MHIFKFLDSLLATYPNSVILVLGGFNQFKPGNLCNSFRLKKLVTKPTRESNILDQAFSTLSPYYDAIILPPIGQSDHSSILLQPILTHAPSLPTTRLQKRDYRAPNKQNLISRLNTVNWTPLMRLNSCEEQLDSFQSVVHVALNSCIPMRTVKLLLLLKWHYHQNFFFIIQKYKVCLIFLPNFKAKFVHLPDFFTILICPFYGRH